MIRKFCNTINVFAVTFDQFNASLLNKSINLFKIKQPMLLIFPFPYSSAQLFPTLIIINVS